MGEAREVGGVSTPKQIHTKIWVCFLPARQQDPARPSRDSKLREANCTSSGSPLECSRIRFLPQGRLWYSRSTEQSFLCILVPAIAIPEKFLYSVPLSTSDVRSKSRRPSPRQSALAHYLISCQYPSVAYKLQFCTYIQRCLLN